MSQINTSESGNYVDADEIMAEVEALHDALTSHLRCLEGVASVRMWARTYTLVHIEEALENFYNSGGATLPEKIAGLLRAVGWPPGNESRVSKAEVSKHIALLVGSFPTANVPEPKVYTRMMVEDVYASRPSQIGLHLGCRRVRRTMKFMPAISEVLSAIEAEEWRLQRYISDCHNVLGQAQHLADLKPRLIESIEEARRRHEAKKARIRKAVLEGDFWLRGHDPKLVEEVKRDLDREGIMPFRIATG